MQIVTRSQRLVVTVEQAAEILGMPKSTLYYLAAEDRIPSIRVGRSVRLSRSWLEEQLCFPIPEEMLDQASARSEADDGN